MGRHALIVLDTHAWIWWRVAPERLSADARRTIDEVDSVVLSTISVWELGTLVRRGRISLDRPIAEWVRAALIDVRLTVRAPDADVSLSAALLPDDFPGDPADRLIYATAVQSGARLVTRDERIERFDGARVVW